jgi:ribosomal protein L29
MVKAELKKLDAGGLKKEITSMKKALFDLRLSGASTHVKDNSQFKKLRAQVAQAFTLLNAMNK